MPCVANKLRKFVNFPLVYAIAVFRYSGRKYANDRLAIYANTKEKAPKAPFYPNPD